VKWRREILCPCLWRWLITILAITALGGSTVPSTALASLTRAHHTLGPADFLNASSAEVRVNSETIQGTPYPLVIYLTHNSSSISFGADSFPGYNAVSFGLGSNDTTTFDASSRFQIFGDGVLLASFQPTSLKGRQHIVRFGTHRVITFTRQGDNDVGNWALINPTLVSTSPSQPVSMMVVPVAKPGETTALESADFLNASSAEVRVNSETIQGTSYPLVIYLTHNSSSISFGADNFPGYNAVSFGLGSNDTTTFDASSRFQVFGDGVLLASFQPASLKGRQHIVRFGTHRVITFTRQGDNDVGNWALINPTLVEPHKSTTSTSSARGTRAAPVAGTMHSTSASLTMAPVVPSGRTEVVNVTTKPGVFVSMIVSFPQGKPLIIGPTKASALGRWSYTFAVPRGDSGKSSVVVVAGGQLLTGGFTIQ